VINVDGGDASMNMNERMSEVARLKQQIDEEYDAACRGLQGLAAGTARHAFIHVKMLHIHSWYTELAALVGEDAADEMLCRSNDEHFACVGASRGRRSGRQDGRKGSVSLK
jgi:hypothetical protein